MSTDTKNQPKDAPLPNLEPLEANQTPQSENTGSQISNNPISGLMEEMQGVELDSKEAELNATSIDDNNGGRIELVDEPEDIKK